MGGKAAFVAALNRIIGRCAKWEYIQAATKQNLFRAVFVWCWEGR